MSDVQKPVEETPAAVPAVETAVEAPAATETTEAPQETTEAAPVVEEAATETAEAPKEDVKEEVKPASEGILGHKGPGLVKGLRFAKRFFYFNEEPVEAKQLSVFHQNEKPAVANPIAAWASQTSTGLLFLTKRAEDKATPAGIFNLADITDVTKEGSNEFIFKVGSQKHTFQASNSTERDSWFVAIEAKSAEAKAQKETITSSEGYKAELEKLTKPAVVVAPVAKKTEETPAKEDKPEEAEAKTEAKEEKPKEAAKSRSQSRKRASIFGAILGKKEAEEKKPEQAKEEATEETKAAEPAAETATETAAEPAAEVAAAETTEAPAAETAAVAAPAETAEEKPEEKKEEKKAKRASIFGNFFQKVTSPAHEKSEKEATAPAPVEETAVASAAPQLDNPVEEAAVEPIEAETVTAAADGEAVKETAETPAEAATPKDKRRTSFFGAFGKKEKKDASDNEATTDGEKETKKANKLGGLFRKPSKAVKLDKEEVAAETDAKAEEAVATEAPVVEEAAAPVEEVVKAPETAATEEPKNVEVPASTPVQAAA
ncbi:uncharacterized protein N7483_004542 [Penicillium malachiteum]|uniref:uncharacterized protein n=1 Tax=Penicillium malachiteum TaxID=1324776 RepID=UPI002548B70C|nr:uncharacterized protein N7483_004542 [Penicillium malachiteum]KAJ5730034.1 hypothetical protein N7483_004542 [Penicillium malachiteum]